MFRIPRWLFAALFLLFFLGGCVSSIRPVWSLMERGWIRPVNESDTPHFPVLVRGADGTFAPAALGELPAESVIVTSQFDEASINKDLRARIGSGGHDTFFRVLERSIDTTRVTLEVPTMKDSKVQSWYDVRGNEIVPRKILHYGPGFAFVVIPPTLVGGLAAAGLFVVFVRPKRP